jgi:hypothetical protein
MRVEKGVELLLEEVSLESAEEVFGLGQGQPEMLDAFFDNCSKTTRTLIGIHPLSIG